MNERDAASGYFTFLVRYSGFMSIVQKNTSAVRAVSSKSAKSTSARGFYINIIVDFIANVKKESYASHSFGGVFFLPLAMD